MALQKIFRSAMPSFRFFFKDGAPANFLLGRFTTANKKHEEELMEEVGEIGRNKSRHAYIFVDEKEPELDTEALSPLELLKLQAKAEARAELLAEIKAENSRAMNASANVSSTSANFAESLNNTAKLEEAVTGESAGAKLIERADVTTTASTIQVSAAARLAAIAAMNKTS